MILVTVKILQRTPQYALLDMENMTIEKMGTKSLIAEAMRKYQYTEQEIQIGLENPHFVLYPDELSEILKDGMLPDEFVSEEELKPLLL